MYRQSATVAQSAGELAGHSVWRRSTDSNSYTQGSAFLAMIAYKLNQKGMYLKDVLRDYFQRHMFQSVTTELFEKELSEATGLDLSKDFDRYIYGKFNATKMQPELAHQDPHHPDFTQEELNKMTMPRP